MTIKWKFRALLADRRFTNAAFADLVGVHKNTVSKWRLADVFPGIDGETLERILKALDCELEELIYRDRED